MLTTLRLSFSHLCEHKFRHGFKDTLTPLCSCSIEAETTTHYFLRFLFYNSKQTTFINDFIFICHFAKGFVLPFQRASFLYYFTLGFFFFIINLTFTPPYSDEVYIW